MSFIFNSAKYFYTFFVCTQDSDGISAGQPPSNFDAKSEEDEETDLVTF